MSDRETKEFVTPGGHTVVMYTYVTGREQRTINSVYLEEVQMTPGEKQSSVLKGTLTQDAEVKALNILIVSLHKQGEEVPIVSDGSDSVLLSDSVLDLSSVDFDAIVAEMNKSTNPKEEEATSQNTPAPVASEEN